MHGGEGRLGPGGGRVGQQRLDAHALRVFGDRHTRRLDLARKLHSAGLLSAEGKQKIDSRPQR